MAGKSNQGRKRFNRLPLLLGSIFIAFTGILIGTIVNNSTTSSPGSSKSTKRPVYNAEVLEIASHFLCACKSCGDKELISCTCDTAIKEKNFIQELLKKGYEVESILSTMETMWGQKKPSLTKIRREME